MRCGLRRLSTATCCDICSGLHGAGAGRRAEAGARSSHDPAVQRLRVGGGLSRQLPQPHPEAAAARLRQVHGARPARLRLERAALHGAPADRRGRRPRPALRRLLLPNRRHAAHLRTARQKLRYADRPCIAQFHYTGPTGPDLTRPT